MMTLLAATRLMPREPARVEMRNKRPLGKCRSARERSEIILENAQWSCSYCGYPYLVLLVSLNSSAHFFLVVALVEPSRR